MPRVTTPARTSPSPYSSPTTHSSPARSAAAAEALADLRLAETARQIGEEARKARPKETTRAYKGKQEEYLAWAEQQGFGASWSIVNGERLAAFLVAEVAYRAPRQRGPKPKPNSKRSNKKNRKKATPAEEEEAEGQEQDLVGAVASG
ncbi:hypothetical protein JCM5296_003809, partial [Sporobolomyces johnsonii]